jgi:hypothetical protein
MINWLAFTAVLTFFGIVVVWIAAQVLRMVRALSDPDMLDPQRWTE